MKLSVILCNYNHAPLVERAIVAMATQSRAPDEIVVVDDGSQDDSWTVLERCARRYPFIRVLRNERNLGFNPSWARAYAEVTGDYIYSASADDYIFPGTFESALHMARSFPRAGTISGKIVAVDADGRLLEEIGVSRWQRAHYATPAEFLRDWLAAEPPNHSLAGATIFRRACLEEIGPFRSDLGSWSDTFAARAVGLKYGVCYVPEAWLCWRVVADSNSGRTARNPQALLDLIAHAAALMRSPAFAGRFPPEHVDAWQSAYRAMLLPKQPPNLPQRALRRAKSAFGRVLRAVR